MEQAYGRVATTVYQWSQDRVLETQIANNTMVKFAGVCMTAARRERARVHQRRTSDQSTPQYVH